MRRNIGSNLDQQMHDFVAHDGYGLSCPHCNHVSTEDDPVVRTIVHVGGIGDVMVLQCADEQACWERGDEQHGFGKCSECGSLLVQETLLGPFCPSCGRAESSAPGSRCVRELRASYRAEPENMVILGLGK